MRFERLATALRINCTCLNTADHMKDCKSVCLCWICQKLVNKWKHTPNLPLSAFNAPLPNYRLLFFYCQSQYYCLRILKMYYSHFLFLLFSFVNFFYSTLNLYFSCHLENFNCLWYISIPHSDPCLIRAWVQRVKGDLKKPISTSSSLHCHVNIGFGS